MKGIQFHGAEHFRCNDLRRWKVEIGKLFSIRLHHWVQGDPEEYQHMHPWDFITIVLWGGYDDVGEGREPDLVRAPTIRYRPKTWRHAVINCRPNTWTIVITGRVVKTWRFFIRDREVGTEEWNGRVCD